MMFMCGRLSRFVNEIINTIVEERNDKTQWEFWLHKDWERSWSEFRATLNDNSSTDAAPTQSDVKQTVSDSANMLMNFRPHGGGVEDESISSIRGNSD